MSEALEIQQPQQAIYQWKSPTAVKQRIIAIQQLLEQVLKPGTKGNEFSGDYGVIPGTGNKPSLWKSGSEQILAMFEIAVDPIVEDLSNSDCFRYRVTARLSHAPTGVFLGAGVGEASTDETKYRWKKTYSQKEFENTQADRRKIKYSQYRDGNGMWADKEEWLIRTEPADLANTVLKMAKKRAQIDATLTVTGASSMFTQDLDELMEDDEEPKTEKKAAKPQTGVKCSECNAEGGHLPSCSKRKPNGAEVKKAADVPPPQEKKQEPPSDKTICSECRKVNGHEPTCKFAPKPEEKPKALCLIESVVQKTKKLTDGEIKKGKTSGEPYLVIESSDNSGNKGKLYCWKTDLHDYLIGKKNVSLLCEVSQQKAGDKTFLQLDVIHELGGVRFEGNKPVSATPPDEDDSLFGAQQ